MMIHPPLHLPDLCIDLDPVLLALLNDANPQSVCEQLMRDAVHAGADQFSLDLAVASLTLTAEGVQSLLRTCPLPVYVYASAQDALAQRLWQQGLIAGQIAPEPVADASWVAVANPDSAALQAAHAQGARSVLLELPLEGAQAAADFAALCSAATQAGISLRLPLGSVQQVAAVRSFPCCRVLELGQGLLANALLSGWGSAVATAKAELIRLYGPQS
ncbi:hypothetical protein H8K47_06820 [Undibacterium sp. CY7W]|uniref:Uncharacterized protein n=1 Tax=Undibacterium rugosum TaxID=2762291 RepID=A0A923HZI7_9BURK|nr:hypothetical protein [Undibacterium rugosum]MBC3935063.1 hypothetical protein [Undibacterium rugosum]